VNLSCLTVREHLAAYTAETLAGDQRQALRAHLSVCAACFGEAVNRDASLLFVRARGAEAPAEDVTRVLSAVRTGIALKTAERRLGPRTSRRLWAALLGTAAALALLLALPRSLTDRQRSAWQVAPDGLEKAAAAQTLRPAPGADGSSTRKPEAAFPAEATVYDWNPGGDEPRVVWIVDGSLDL